MATDPVITSRCPYYHLVPKDLEGNLAFRAKALKKAAGSPAYQRALWQMCARDLLFYVNFACWTFDPRRNIGQQLPMITFDYQDTTLLDIESALGDHDLLIEKSKDMGASWMILNVFEWRWKFQPFQKFFVVSRKEDSVDKANDPDSLFWKLDYIQTMQPSWMALRKPDLLRSSLTFVNGINHSAIIGASTTGSSGMGGRATATFLDEAADFEHDMGYKIAGSTQGMTPCRIFNSTPQGASGIFYDMSRMDIKKIRLHWSIDPRRNQGLYTSENGVAKVLDIQYKFPDDYTFLTDNKLRSPWYDGQCKRTPNPSLMAENYDIEYLGSGAHFFDFTVLDRHQAEHCRPPLSKGELSIGEGCQPLAFNFSERGKLHLWVDLTDGLPPKGDYAGGADISGGTGASDSTLSVWDIKTGKKVAELVTNQERPEAFASICVGVMRWFNGGRLGWEAQGIGRQFGAKIYELGYYNVYHKDKPNKYPPEKTDIAGWWPTKESKKALLGDYQEALAKNICANQSQEGIRQCREFVYFLDRSVGHVKEKTTSDASGQGENHGDLTIADAIGVMVMRELMGELAPPVVVTKEPEYGSFAWRIKQGNLEDDEELATALDPFAVKE